MKVLVLYMPVLHQGYLDLFRGVCPDVVALVMEDVLQGLPDDLLYLKKKDLIRAVPTSIMVSAVCALFPCEETTIVAGTAAVLTSLGESKEHVVVMPDEDVSVALADKYFGGVSEVSLVVPPAPRLRYHRNNVEEQKLLVPERRIELSQLDRTMMALATDVAKQSPDWWRQVGGVLLTSSGCRIVAYNEHQPHEQIAATFGDPRSLFKSGVRTDLSFGDHAEHVLIGEAARRRIATDGSSVYLTTFPCLPCSRLLVRSGVKRLFYRDPSYGLLDADEYLKLKGVELIEVSGAN